MTTYALGAWYPLHLGHPKQLPNLPSDLRHRLNRTLRTLYIFWHLNIDLFLTIHSAYVRWGFPSSSAAGDPQIVAIRFKASTILST